MKDSTQNEMEGSAKQASGKIKEVTGKAVRSPDLKADGQIEQAEGKAQKKVGQIERAIEE